MNNYSIRIDICNKILIGKFSIEDMEILSKASLLLYNGSTTPNGWFVAHETYNEIIKLCKVP